MTVAHDTKDGWRAITNCQPWPRLDQPTLEDWAKRKLEARAEGRSVLKFRKKQDNGNART